MELHTRMSRSKVTVTGWCKSNLSCPPGTAGSQIRHDSAGFGASVRSTRPLKNYRKEFFNKLIALIVLLLSAPCATYAAGFLDIEQTFADVVRDQQRVQALSARIVESRNLYSELLLQLTEVRSRCQSGGGYSPAPDGEIVETSTQCLESVAQRPVGACVNGATAGGAEFEQTLKRCEAWLSDQQNDRQPATSQVQTGESGLAGSETQLLSQLEAAARGSEPAARAAQLAVERFVASANRVELWLRDPGNEIEPQRRAEIQEGLTRMRVSSQFDLSQFPVTDQNLQCGAGNVADVAPDPVLQLLAERLREVREDLSAQTRQCLTDSQTPPPRPVPLPQTSQPARPSQIGDFNPLLESGVPGRGPSVNAAKQIADDRLKVPIVRRAKPATAESIKGYGEAEPQPVETPLPTSLSPALGTPLSPIGGTTSTTRNPRQEEMAKDFADPPDKQ